MLDPGFSCSKKQSIDKDSNLGDRSWFASLAKSVKKNIPVAIDNFTSSIQRTAQILLDEIDEAEKESAKRRSTKRYDNDDDDSQEFELLPLPWEISFKKSSTSSNNIGCNSEPIVLMKEDKFLKNDILALSNRLESFTTPFERRNLDEESLFVLDASRINLISRLLHTDTKLRTIHRKLSGRSDSQEEMFWKNYFYHCDKLRSKREKEIKEGDTRVTSHDDELDAELVWHPPSSCTGFYPRTHNLSSCHETMPSSKHDQSIVLLPSKVEYFDNFVLVEDDDFH
jgi:hypothetical protein